MKNFISQVKSNKKIILFCYLEYLLLFGLVSRYVEFTNGWNILTLLGTIFIAYLFLSDTKNSQYRMLLLLGVFIVCNVLYSHKYEYLLVNMMTLVPSICIAVSFYVLLSHKKLLKDFLEKHCIYLNIFYIINIFVLFLQVNGTGFMIRDKWLEINKYYLDQCCGLFGNAGTHELGFFTIFMVIYNLYISDHLDIKRKKIFQTYSLLTTLAMFYLSTKNDNMALFILLPSFIVFYYLLKYKDRLKGINIKNIHPKYIVSGVLVIFIMITMLGLDSFFIDSVLPRLQRVLLFDMSNIAGSNERLAIPMMALLRGDGWLFGQGLGAWMWHKGNYFGFEHFGLSSIGSFVMLGGIWFYLYFTYCLTYVVSLFKNNKFKITFFAIIVLLSIYSNIFTSTVSLFWIFMFSSLFNMLGEDLYV